MSIRGLAVSSLAAAALASTTILAGPAGAAPAAAAVVRTGRCSGTSSYSLQVQRETASVLSVDWGVDMRRHVGGVRWAVAETDNGSAFVTTTRRTGRDGSFSVTRRLASHAADVISAKATNRVTGETCAASATL